MIPVVLSIVILSTGITNAFSLFGENKEKNTNRSNAVAVTVNGAKITEGQIEAIVNKRVSQTARSVPGRDPSEHHKEVRKIVMWELIFRELVFQKGKQNNIAVSDEEVTEMINKIAAQEHLSFDEYKQEIERYHDDFPEYQKSLKAQLLYGKLLEKEYSDKLKPTEEQMKAYYAENKNYYRTKEEFYIKYIDVIPEKDSNEPNQAKVQAKTKAEQILQKIRNGEDFDKLLESERSGKRPPSREEIETKLKQRLKEAQKKLDSNNPNDPNQRMARVDAKFYGLLLKDLQDGKDMNSPYEKTRSGKLPSTRTELRLSYSPEFEKAVLALKPEQISNVVEGKHGFYIIKLIKHVEANIPSFEEVKERVRQHASNKPTEQAYYEYIQKIMQEADIKYANEQDKIEIPSSPTKE
jgi:parvulin-like peptidyl-prolyl isomerase